MVALVAAAVNCCSSDDVDDDDDDDDCFCCSELFALFVLAPCFYSGLVYIQINTIIILKY